MNLSWKLGYKLLIQSYSFAIKRIHQRDVVTQQKKVAGAQGLAFIAPVFWIGFPAILKGWFERVFTLGFAYSLTLDGCRGHL